MPKPHQFPIFDGHNDTVLNLHRLEVEGNGRSFFEHSDRGHIDLPRARDGGFGGGFFAIFVPNKTKKKMEPPEMKPGVKLEVPLPKPLKHKYALRFTTAITARLFHIEAQSEGQVKIVRHVDALAKCLHEGVLAAILHFEGAETIDTNLDALHIFYAAGLRSIGPVWSRANAFACGVPFNFPDTPDIGPGLTDLGRALVQECNQLGIMIDLSHMNEKGFWDVAALTEAPLVATHSNAHALCPSPRNLTDRQLDAITESGGMVGINFHVGFLREDGRFDQETSLTEIIRHLDYLVERIGIDHVGFGSDFDGAHMPQDLKDVAGLPKLIAALQERGYDIESLRKITHENWIRVLKQTWKTNE